MHTVLDLSDSAADKVLNNSIYECLSQQGLIARNLYAAKVHREDSKWFTYICVLYMHKDMQVLPHSFTLTITSA